jgi:uncharacterized SAM-binding protein YcdF (DUF218 family)
MSTGPKQPIDWDGLATFGLTVAVVLAGLGLPLLFTTARVLAIGLGARHRTTASLPPSPMLVVFGKRLIRGRPDADYRARLTATARLMADHPGCRILVLGGCTGMATISEAEAGARLLRRAPGAAACRIDLEQASVNTLTNLRNVRTLLAHEEARGPLLLISNRYHLARVGQMAGSLGLAHQLRAAEGIAAALGPATLWRWPLEGFYSIWFATGKRWAILTRNRRMLARVT